MIASDTGTGVLSMHTRIFLSMSAAASLILSLGLSSMAQQPAWPPAASHTTLNLWPAAIPDPVPTTAPEGDTATAKDKPIAGRPIIRWGNVATPTITLYSPQGANTGAAVVVFPGGGYNILAIDLEGTEVCDWLNSEGITCILLKYRVPNTGPYIPNRPQPLKMRSAP
jgi:acetyl esterase/lipase